MLILRGCRKLQVAQKTEYPSGTDRQNAPRPFREEERPISENPVNQK